MPTWRVTRPSSCGRAARQDFPMMMTPAGTISPSRVFIIGAGVAGLQAIATAKRLGPAWRPSTRGPEVEEQVKSLGARFVKIDSGKRVKPATGTPGH